jgi:hypothetical protein
MMTDATLHPLVSDYLTRLTQEARRLPDDQARDLVADLTEHIGVGLGAAPSEVEVRNLLDRLGTPAEVVDAAGPQPSSSPAPGGTAAGEVGGLELGAVIALFVAEVLFILVPLAALVWVVGLVLLLLSKAWSGREKLRGFLSLATGFPLMFVILSLSLVVGSVESCTGSASSAGETTMVCTSSGPPPWIGWIVLAALVAYVLFQVRTAYVLLRHRSR